MEHHLSLLVILAGGAAVVPFAARRLAIPSAIMEMLFGVVLFQFFVHERPEWFIFMKELGLIYLMFMAGMELDLKDLMREGRFTWYALIALCSIVLTPVLMVRMGWPYYLGIVVSVTSAGVILPVLRESDMLRTRLGRTAMGVALTGEFIAIMVITALYIANLHGLTVMSLLSLLKLAVLFTAAVVVLKLIHLAAWWNQEKVDRVMRSEDPVEEGTRAVLFLAVAGGLLALQAGVEPILGSFMAGAVLRLVFKRRGRFEEKVSAVGFGFLTPMFFIGVGGDFDLASIRSIESAGMAFALTGMVLASKVFPVLFAPLLKTTLREGVCIMFLISAPLSMMVVAGALGLKMGLLGEEEYSAVILASMLSGVLYPMAFRALAQRPPSADRATPSHDRKIRV